MSKYFSKKTLYLGVVYDSKKEAKRQQELDLLASTGKISGLERQKKFILIESFDYRGKKIRGTSWVADFYYFMDGEWVAEDVKSDFTRKKPDYIIKKKLFMLKYPEIRFYEHI